MNPLDLHSDEALMEMYQSGDAQAFDALYARHSGRVLGYLTSRLKDKQAAHEVLQASFLKLHRFRHQYHLADPFGPWFFALIRNTLTDSKRKENRNPSAPWAEDPSSVLEALVAPAPVAPDTRSESLLANLDAPHREVLELRYSKDLSFEAIATRLGISAASARQRVSRAIRKLRGLHPKMTQVNHEK